METKQPQTQTHTNAHTLWGQLESDQSITCSLVTEGQMLNPGYLVTLRRQNSTTTTLLHFILFYVYIFPSILSYFVKYYLISGATSGAVVSTAASQQEENSSNPGIWRRVSLFDRFITLLQSRESEFCFSFCSLFLRNKIQ